jgi:DNA-binding FrmR family transcriptional regulator
MRFYDLDIYPLRVYDGYMKSHYEDVKVQAQKRINIIKGQLDGLQRMIDNDEYCIDLLNQSLAIQNSLRSLDSVLFERHLTTHVSEQFKNEEEKAVTELVRLFKRVNQ